jgi:hypothetical protein
LIPTPVFILETGDGALDVQRKLWIGYFKDYSTTRIGSLPVY